MPPPRPLLYSLTLTLTLYLAFSPTLFPPPSIYSPPTHIHPNPTRNPHPFSTSLRHALSTHPHPSSSSTPHAIDITIVVTTYNNADEIGDAVSSLLAGGDELRDRGKTGEIVFVDDRSSDKTYQILKTKQAELAAHSGYASVLVVQNTEPCRSPACGRNLGASLGSGSWVLVLDGDDWLPQGTLGVYMDTVETHPDANVVLGGHTLVGDTAWVDKLGIDHWWPCGGYDPDQIYARNYVPSHALVSRSLWHTGSYTRVLPSLEDWVFWWGVQELVGRDGVVLVCVQANTLFYRQHAPAPQPSRKKADGGSRNAHSLETGTYVRAAMITMAPLEHTQDEIAAALRILESVPESLVASWYTRVLRDQPRAGIVYMWRALARMGQAKYRAAMDDAMASIALGGGCSAGVVPCLGTYRLALDTYCRAAAFSTRTKPSNPSNPTANPTTQCVWVGGWSGWALV